MTIYVSLLDASKEEAYGDLVRADNCALIYASLAYRDFLQKVLVRSRALYLVAFENGRLVGALPTFLINSPAEGKLLNSLPFFGSNGGIILHPQTESPLQIKRALLRAFSDLSRMEDVRSATLISNPRRSDRSFYLMESGATHFDERVGQFSALPENYGMGTTEEALMASFRSKTRNLVRKANKQPFRIRISTSQSDVAWLQAVHEQNMEDLGGTVKPLSVFEAVCSTFQECSEFRIFVVEMNGARIAAVLILQYGKCLEYFTPVVVKEFRTLQPLSAAIFAAMKDGVERGCTDWNWGGTWLTQPGVHHFKAGWGAQDMPYHYYVTVYDETLFDLTRDEIAMNFPNFYAFPYLAKEAIR